MIYKRLSPWFRMRKGVGIVVLFLFLSVFVGAVLEVNNVQVQKIYNLGETFKGTLGLKVSGENATLLITSNQGGNITLFELIDKSSSNYTCRPVGCRSEYIASKPALEKTLALRAGEPGYFGFVVNDSLRGTDIIGIEFDLHSNFPEGNVMPLEIIFGEQVWKYSAFSETYAPKDYGCYKNSSRRAGPLLNNVDDAYCEIVSLKETAAVRMGAEVIINDTSKLFMELLDEQDNSIGECTYNPSNASQSLGCIIKADTGETFSSGNYSVCVGVDKITKYRLYKDTSGESCGYKYSNGKENMSEDYALFAQEALYASAAGMNRSLFDFEELKDALDDYIEDVYSRDCRDKCVIPFEVRGVSQNLVIDNVSLSYSADETKDIYTIQAKPARITFNGTVVLEKAGFPVTREGTFILNVGSKKLLEESVQFREVPVITSFYPETAPAGVPTTFSVGMGISGASIGGTYQFDFGNGTKKNVSSSSVVHTFSNLGTYPVKVTFKSGSFTSEKTFSVLVVSPLDFLNEQYTAKRNALNDVKRTIATMPVWYGADVKTKVGLEGLEKSLDALRVKLTSSNNSNASFSGLITEMTTLKIPKRIEVVTSQDSLLVSTASSINLAPLEELEGFRTGAQESAYQDEVFKWQNGNIDSRMTKEDFFLVSEEGNKESLGRAYVLDIETFSQDKGMLVIPISKGALRFKEEVLIQEVGGSTLIELESNSRRVIEFYSLSTVPSFFVSPSLKNMVVTEVDACNFNQVCEVDLGEDVNTCRSDCKPLGKAIFYAGFALLFVLILYTWLQLWYNSKYEAFLFPDKKQLYNLLMFVSNAIAQGKSYGDIAQGLEKQGWNKERVAFIMAKARGRRTGMVEIIPISKLSSYFRNREARKKVALSQVRSPGWVVNHGGGNSMFQVQKT